MLSLGERATSLAAYLVFPPSWLRCSAYKGTLTARACAEVWEGRGTSTSISARAKADRHGEGRLTFRDPHISQP